MSEYTYPKQGSWLNRRVEVCFNCDTSKLFHGTIVREDDIAPGDPGYLIIKLDDGRYVLSVECQYSLAR